MAKADPGFKRLSTVLCHYITTIQINRARSKAKQLTKGCQIRRGQQGNIDRLWASRSLQMSRRVAPEERQKLWRCLQEESPKRHSVGSPHEETGKRMRKDEESQGKYPQGTASSQGIRHHSEDLRHLPGFDKTLKRFQAPIWRDQVVLG